MDGRSLLEVPNPAQRPKTDTCADEIHFADSIPLSYFLSLNGASDPDGQKGTLNDWGMAL